MNQSIDKLLWIIGISGLGAALSECAVLSSIKNGTTDSIAFGVRCVLTGSTIGLESHLGQVLGPSTHQQFGGARLTAYGHGCKPHKTSVVATNGML